MTTPKSKPEASTPRPEKPRQEAITDLSNAEQYEKDAQNVKGGFGKRRVD